MIDTLPGFRQFYPEDCAARNFLFSTWRRVASGFGFQEIDGPQLEPLELFTEKSGDEIVGQLFNFVDKGERNVALRPELTPRVAVMAGSKANALRRPIKWFSLGEMFRYEKPQKGRLRAFYQLNVDLFGEEHPSADAEVMALALHTLRAFGLTEKDIVLRLSDRTLWLDCLHGWGLDDASAMRCLGVIDKIERTERPQLIGQLDAILPQKGAELLASAETLLKIKSLDDLEAFIEKSFAGTSHIEALQARIEDWRYLLNTFEAMNLAEYIRVDLSIVRGLAYYTGFVFEIFDRAGESRALTGGGRYNHLVKKMGGPDLPAVGFGMGDVTLRNLLEEKGLMPSFAERIDCYVIYGSEKERAVALADVVRLRELGFIVDYPLKGGSFGKLFKAANQKGARYVLVYGEEELNKNVVKVKEMLAGKEQELHREHFIEMMNEILRNG